ncbi:hypothetical protein ONS95_002162 [Cadophora gregata]|uniref:uncharacterized protein n=1 Tax=Cadophora gregata TaxID=51156 RepID=UPI0026DD1BED|nr:uncharacterized protein ONS95_002162 [Cadophora gregata]KAK0109470.1 hypothetical protein ONS95_002162 [Cadophora gregata]KAK0110902.1 hypothetical protein ONS96_002488 [Cadophora gregata f. sp. sojae]
MHRTEPLEKRPTGSRRSHAKVRSGCVTCKVRRVKCDEQRPFCKRCIRFGIQCGGYPPPKRQKDLTERPKQILLPKSHNIRSHPTPYAAPSVTKFQTEEESRCFDIFSRNTAYEIFPNVEMGKLRVMFLQACEARDAIRHAIIALGALDMTSRVRSQAYVRDAARRDFGGTASHHYKYAIQEYAKAIKYAQTEGGQDLRTALMTSLMILAFEGWIGSHEVAVQQIRIGTGLLMEWKQRQMENPSTAPTEDENLLAHVFTRLSIQLRPPPKEKPPQTSPPTSLPPLKVDLPPSLKRLPLSFGSIAEAGVYYGLIVRFAVTFVSQCLPRIARSGSLTGSYTPGSASEAIPPEITQAQLALTESLHQWMAAFAPLKYGAEFKQLDQRKACITLELQMKATYMGTIKSLAQDEMVYDAYYDIYKDIVDLSESLLNCSPASKVPKFSFDSGVIIPLWFTGHKCRDPVLRRRAIALLLTFPRREGVWDSVFAGLVIECVREFEEEYIDGGRIPWWARIRTTNFDIDLEKRIVEVLCEQRLSADSDETVIRRKTVDYYVYTGITLEQVEAVIAK